MSNLTDHERYEQAMSAGVLTGSRRTCADTTTERIQSLAAERDAYLAALLAKQRDVDALLAENVALSTALAAALGKEAA